MSTRHNKRRKFTWLMVAVIALIVIARLMFFGSSKKVEEVIKEIRPQRGDIRVYVTTSGLVKPQNRLEIKPPIAGRIEKVLVEEGDSVKQGQILAWMSSTERAALLDAARSQGAEAATHWEDVYKPAPLVAPLEGTVIVRAVEPGQTVTSQDAALVLADRLIVKAQVDETDIGRVKPGQPAEITLDAYPYQKVKASVDHIAYESQIVNNVTIYEVDILPDKVPGTFRSGMSANVNITVAEKEDVLLLPAEAVKENHERKYVLVKVEGQGKPVSRNIEVGISDGKKVEIISGLNEDDIVVITRRSHRHEQPSKTNPFLPFGRRQRKK